MHNYIKTLQTNIINALQFILAFIFVKFFTIFPIEVASNIGGFLGRNIGYFVGRFTGDNKKGIRQIGFAFKDMPQEKRIELLKKTYENIGRFIMEYINQYKMDAKWFKKNVIIPDEDLLLKYCKSGSFGITAHYGNWEILQRFVALHGIEVNVIYNPLQNPLLNKLYLSLRVGAIQTPKGSNSMKQLINLIKNKKTTGILIDQRDKQGEIFNFFNIQAHTSTVIQRLAIKYNYDIFPVRCKRLEDDPNKFIMDIGLALQTTKQIEEEKVQDLTNQSLRILESWVLESPSNWLLWFYSRWRIFK